MIANCEDAMIAWLADEVCPSELNEARQRDPVLARCRASKLEAPGRMERLIGSANRIADERFCEPCRGCLLTSLPCCAASLLVQRMNNDGVPGTDVGEHGLQPWAVGVFADA